LKARPFLAVGSKQRIRPLTTVGRTSASGQERPLEFAVATTATD